MSFVRRSFALSLSLLLVAACRPGVPGEATPSASSIAGALIPSQPMSVVYHLPGAPSGLHAPFAFLTQEEALAAAEITVSITTPTVGVDPFAGAEDPSTVDLYVASPAAALSAREAGSDLVLIAGLAQQSDWRLVTPVTSGISDLADLAGKSIFVNGLPGDAATALAALSAAGVDLASLSLTYATDLSSSFDPIPILDGTYAAAIVSSVDGWPRLVQGPDLVTGASVGVEGLVEFPITPTSLDSGLAIWAHASALTSDNAKIAAAASLVALAEGLAFCRDSIEDCAALFLGIGTSDQDQETLVWSINTLNSQLWPAANGVLWIDTKGVTNAVATAVSAGVLKSPFKSEYVDGSVLALAELHWPAGLDRNGEGWTILALEIPLY